MAIPSSRPKLAGLALLAACVLFARGQATPEMQEPARLTYTKTLKGSSPEFLKVTVDSNGEGSFEGKKLDEPSNPRPLKLSPASSRRLFELAAELDNFQSVDLESHRRVANLGLKTFTFEQGSQVNRAEFNYTQNRTAQELVALFEGIATVEEHIANLEYAMKYDHLSLPKELRLIQIDLDSKALAEPQLMVPTLEAIAKNSRFLHLAQVQAEDILQRVRTSN